METANEGEGDSFTRSTTASEQITEGPQARDSETDDSQFKEDTLQQMLTCETGNTGTEVSTPPCNKRTTGQGLHGTSPDNDNLDKVQDAISANQLEACDEVTGLDSLDTHTSSDESGDWETASEASVEYVEEATVKIKDLDSNRKMDNNGPEVTGDNLIIQTTSGHLDQTDSERTGELAEEIQQCCERTSSKDLQSEQAISHGTMPADNGNEESLCDVKKTESEDLLHHGDEALRKRTVTEESDPNFKEMVTEGFVSHFANTEPEKSNDEESDTGGSVTDVEKSGLPDEVAVSEWTRSQEENDSHEEVVKSIETQMEETANKCIEAQKAESASEQARPKGREPVCEVREPQADKNVLHTEATTQKCAESLVEITDRESTVPDSNELARIETEPCVVEMHSEQCSSLMEKAVSVGTGNCDEEAVRGQAVFHAEDSACEMTMFPAVINEPCITETPRRESGPYANETNCQRTVTDDEACVNDETGPCVGMRVCEGTLNEADDSGSGEESETHTVDTISEEIKSMADHRMSAEFEGNHITKVEEKDNSGYAIDQTKSPLDSKIELVNNEEMVDSQSTINTGSDVDQKEITEGEVEIDFTECVSEETASKVTAHDHKEGVNQLLDEDIVGTVSKETEGVGTETVCPEMSSASEETVSIETECFCTEADHENAEGSHKETVIKVTLGHSKGTVIEDVLGDYTESALKQTDGSIEMFNVDTPYACKEIRIKYNEPVTVNTQADSGDDLEFKTAADGIQTIDCKESVNETQTVANREILSTMKETSDSDNLDTQTEELTASFEETPEQGRDIHDKDNIYVERIVDEPSSDGELVKPKENQNSVERRVLVGFKKLHGEFSEIPPNIQNPEYIVKECTAKENELEENELEPNEDGKSSHAEVTRFQAPKEDIETMRLEGESSDINSGEKKRKLNNLEANIRTSDDLEEQSHKRSFEIDIDQAVAINDVIPNMDPDTNTEIKIDTVEQVPLDEVMNKKMEEDESDKAQSLHETETRSVPGILLKPISLRPMDFTNYSLLNLNVVNEPEESNMQNFQVVEGVGVSHHKDITDSSYREPGSQWEEQLSFQKEAIEDGEQYQGVIHVERIAEDEPDFNKGLIFDRGFKSGTFSPKTEPFTKPEIDETFVQKETLTVAAEPVLTDRTFSHGGPIVDDQGKVDSRIKTGQHIVEGTGIENLALPITRQRSNTDPCLIYDQEENSTQQDDQHGKGKHRPRLRSVTPPLDNFTASFTATSPQAIMGSKPLEKDQTSIVYPPVDYDISEEQKAEEATPKREYTFFPTQIFNPLFIIREGTEKHGFYQEEPLLQHAKGNINKRRFPSPPQDTEVLLKVQQPHTINRPSRSPSSSGTTMETSDTNQPAAHPVAPLWLPPRPLRHTESAVGKDFRPLKPTESPLVRRPTVRHKKNTVANPPFKRFGALNLPTIPQEVPSGETSSLEKSSRPAGTKVHISSTTKQRPLPKQPKINEQDIDQSKNKSPMERLAEAEESSRKSSRSPEVVLRRGMRSQIQPSAPDTTHSSHRYSTFIHSSHLLYQEYSDVALNQEIQRQKPGDSPAEEKDPGSPRQRRRILSSQDSYLQRLSISSADSLWQDLPKIRDSVAFMSMSREEQKLQEAKFELIMSEALYLRSLNIAVDHFQRSMELQEVLSAQDRQWLFSRLSEVRDASNDFLFDLEEEFENNMYNFQVCDVVISHEPNFRKVYLPYVTNQTYQDRTFQRLMNDNPRFQQVLSKLESDAVCQRLSLKSFLILPFQRITRLRLLLQNILKRSAPSSNEELQATEGHNAIEKLIRDCNEGVQKMKDTEELILLHQKIQFECKIFPLISASRRLVKHGEVTSLEYNPISFKWKGTTRQVYLHLFSDCLLLSRIREGGRFVVFDHASDFRVERCEIKLHSNQKNIFRVFLRDSAATQARDGYMDGQETQYIFRTETQSQKLRWIYALSPPREEIDFLKDGLIQVQCLKSYKARENDELSLEKADILMVTQNSDDGWLCGIRLSDLHSGWVPQCHVQFINRNACLRNLQEEKRLQNARAKLHPTGAK